MQHKFRKFHLLRMLSTTLTVIAVQFIFTHPLVYATYLEKEISLEGDYLIRAAKLSDAPMIKPIVMKHLNNICEDMFEDSDEQLFHEIIENITMQSKYQSALKVEDPDNEFYLFFRNNQLIGAAMLEKFENELFDYNSIFAALNSVLADFNPRYKAHPYIPTGCSLQLLSITPFFMRTSLSEEQFILGHFMNAYVTPRLCKQMKSVSEENSEEVEANVSQMLKSNVIDPLLVNSVKIDNIFYVSAIIKDEGCPLDDIGFNFSQPFYYFSPLSCTLAIPSSPNRCTNKHHMGKPEFPFQVSGFYYPEGHLRWTEGNETVIRLPLAHKDHHFKSVKFDTSAHVSEHHPQTAEIYVNGDLVKKLTYTNYKPNEIVNIALPDNLDEAIIRFIIPNPISPAQLQGDPKLDPRVLGLSFRDVELSCGSKTYHLGSPFGFPYPLSGFAKPEGTQIWTEGSLATIYISLASNPNDRPYRISFLNTNGLVSDQHSQEVCVVMNGKIISTLTYTPTNNNQQIDLVIPQDFRGDMAKIQFFLPNPTSVAALTGQQDSDSRLLGISLKEVLFSYLPRK